MAFKRDHSLFVYLLRILFAKPEINRPDVFAEPPVSHSTDCQPCSRELKKKHDEYETCHGFVCG